MSLLLGKKAEEMLCGYQELLRDAIGEDLDIWEHFCADMEKLLAIESKVTTTFSDDPPTATSFTKASMRKDEQVRNAEYHQSKADLLTELGQIKAIVDVLAEAHRDTIRVQVKLRSLLNASLPSKEQVKAPVSTHVRTKEERATFSKRASSDSTVDLQILPPAAATNSLSAEKFRRLRRSKASAQLRPPPSGSLEDSFLRSILQTNFRVL